MLNLCQALILIAFSLAAAIFHSLLGIERSVWRIAMSETAVVPDEDIRGVNKALQGLSGYLPPSNGVMIFGGLTGLIWQCVQLHWTWQPSSVLAAWLVGQLYILTFGKIVQAVRNLRRTDSSSPLDKIRRILRQLIRQHFNGFLHAVTIVVLELALIVSA